MMLVSFAAFAAQKVCLKWLVKNNGNETSSGSKRTSLSCFVSVYKGNL